MKIGREHKGYIHNPVNDAFRFRSKLQPNSTTNNYKLINLIQKHIQLYIVDLITILYIMQDIKVHSNSHFRET